MFKNVLKELKSSLTGENDIIVNKKEGILIYEAEIFSIIVPAQKFFIPPAQNLTICIRLSGQTRKSLC